MGEQRTRQNSTFVREYGSQSVTNCGNVTTNSQTSLGTIVGNGVEWTMTDTVDPGFRKASSNGAIFNNPMKMLRVSTSLISKSTRSWAINTANCSCTPSTTVKNGTGTGALYEPANSVPSSSLFTPSFNLETAIALAGTAAQANVAEPEVMGMVDIAELGKTVKMLKSPVLGIRQLVEKVKRDHSKSRSALTVTQFLSNHWLRYRYGIVPLVLSIQGSMKALAKERTSKRYTARGNGYVSPQTYSSTVNYLVPSGQVGWNRTVKWTCNQTWEVRAGVLYEHFSSFQNDFGLSLHEIPSTAIELVPFSFVADWVANLSDYIRAVTPKAGVRILSSWTTVRRFATYNYEQTGSAVNVYGACYTYSGSPGFKFVRTEKEVTRSPGVTVDLVSKISEIDFARRKDLLHAADALALLAQMFGKGPKGHLSTNFAEVRV